ncbi:MAG: hypothetical protein II746_03850, partial [Bacteroidaceae bacterium]|nr:hypothetical protein [Bacteroidaceae bacterium]
HALNRRTEFKVLRTTYGLFELKPTEKAKIDVEATKETTTKEAKEKATTETTKGEATKETTTEEAKGEATTEATKGEATKEAD